MTVIGTILLVVSAVLGISIVNFAYRLYMRIMNADSMYYNPRKKVTYIIIVSGAIWLTLLKIFFGV